MRASALPSTGRWVVRGVDLGPIAVQAGAALALFANLAALAFALSVQLPFLPQDRRPQILWLWGIATVVGLAAWLVGDAVLPAPPPLPAVAVAPITAPRRWLSRALMAVSAVATVAGLVLLYRDLTSPIGSWFWLIGMGGIVAGFAVRELPLPRLGWRRIGRRDWVRWAGAFIVIATAFALRVVWLDQVPAFFNADEAITADWALMIYHHGLSASQPGPQPMSPFRTAYQGAPMGAYYLYAVVMEMFDQPFVGLHVLSAISGGLVVWLFYLMLREVVREWAALAAAFLLAFSHNHLFWSRTGINVILLSFFATAAMWLVLPAIRSQGYLRFALAGFLAGAGLHVYHSASAVGAILGAFFLYLWLRDHSFMRQRWRHLLVMCAAAALAFLPLGFWYLFHPESVSARPNQVIFQRDAEQRERLFPGMDPLGATVENVRRNLWGLAVTGDETEVHYPIRQPLLDPIAATLLLTGIAGFTFCARGPALALANLWLWIPTLFIVLFTDRAPAMSRLLVVMPAVYVVVGVTLDRIGRLAVQAGGRLVLGTLAVPLLLALGYAAVWNYTNFFVVFPQLFPEDRWTALARLSHDAGPDYKSYVFRRPNLAFEREYVRPLAENRAGQSIDPSDLPVAELGHRDGLFVVPETPIDGGEVVKRLQYLYPSGRLEERRNGVGQLLFHVYRVPAAELNTMAPRGSTWFEPDARFGRIGSRFGEMRRPQSLAVGRDGRVYVADRGNGRISAYDRDGEPAASWGWPGSGDGAFQQLVAVAVAPDGGVYGLDRDGGWIQHFAADGRWIGKVGGPERLAAPIGLALGSDGTLVVADPGQSQIVRLAPDGAELGRVGRAGVGPGQFQALASVAVADDGTIYALDGAGGRVERFTSDLRYLDEWAVVPIDADDGGSVRIALALTDGGAVYVANPAQSQIDRYGPGGHREWSLGRRPGGGPIFGRPLSVATDQAGNVYALDGEHHLISRYDTTRRRPR